MAIPYTRGGGFVNTGAKFDWHNADYMNQVVINQVHQTNEASKRAYLGLNVPAIREYFVEVQGLDNLTRMAFGDTSDEFNHNQMKKVINGMNDAESKIWNISLGITSPTPALMQYLFRLLHLIHLTIQDMLQRQKYFYRWSKLKTIEGFDAMQDIDKFIKQSKRTKKMNTIDLEPVDSEESEPDDGDAEPNEL